MEIPKVIEERIDELNDIVKQHPKYIPLKIAARYIGANEAGLRESIYRGGCTWGIAWQKDIHGNRTFKILTLPFYLTMTNNAIIQIKRT